VSGDDLLAVTMLNVAWPPLAVRWMFGDGQAEVEARLADLDPYRPLWEATDRDLDVAGGLWTLLQEHYDVGPVIAGKFLARKRPHMIPVIDSVVIAAIGAPPHQYWLTLRECLRDGSVRSSIENLRRALPRDASTLPSSLPSTLRLLDVAVWMRGSHSEGARRERQNLGCPEP
jgi:Family of unknown function (DUF6308)